MILYHGSFTEVSKPVLTFSRKNLDFWMGFYTTPIYEQAEKWSLRFKRNGKDGVISVYNFNEDAFSSVKALKFADYSDEWLEFIISCRSGRDMSDYDIVMGGVANDKVFNTVELYFDGLIDKSEAITRLRYEKTNLQLCFRSQEVIDRFLSFERSISI